MHRQDKVAITTASGQRIGRPIAEVSGVTARHGEESIVHTIAVKRLGRLEDWHWRDRCGRRGGAAARKAGVDQPGLGPKSKIMRPSGTVTFLMSDIEGSTRRWEDQPERMRVALARHDEVIADAVESNGGWMFKHTGDGIVAAFGSARAAVDAAIAAQRKLELPVRMGICSGAAELRADDYFGPALNRTARTMEVGHGGQILVAASAASLIEAADLIDLGEHRLRDLLQPQRIWQAHVAGLRQNFPPLRTLDAVAGNLPSQSTSFLGREDDIAEIGPMLRRARLVTLIGAGGVGKTRLSLQAAASVSPHFQGGCWQVQLASVVDPAATSHVVAAVVGVTQQQGLTIEQSIVETLGARQLLVILDNCEHLINEAAALARIIIDRCPGVVLLATSREALAIEGEEIYLVAPLDVRDGIHSPAVALFVERAHSVAPDFFMNGHGDDVSEICRRLDGIPLAIELAAARIRAMSPAQIRARLDDRFRLLTGGPRHGLERHHTLRHAVQWSFDLLTPAERAVLSCCSVFAGGFSLEAAEQVCVSAETAEADILDLLDGLVRKSLVSVDRSGTVVRYSLLETFRQFGEEQLTAMHESEAARNRHAGYYAADSRVNFELWRSPRQIEAYRWLDREMGNLRAAFRWAVDRGDIETAGDLAANLGDMGSFQLRDEVRLWAAEIVDAARRVRHRRLPMILSRVASAEWFIGFRLDSAMSYACEALELSECEDFDSFVWAHADQAFIAALQGNFALCAERANAGANHPVDAQQDRLCTALRGYFLTLAGQHDAAMRAVDADVAAAEATNIPYSMAIAWYSKGRAFAEVDPAGAIAAYERGISIARDSGNRLCERTIVAELAALQARAGSPVRALATFRQALNLWQRTPDALGIAHGIGGLIILFERLGRPVDAVTLHAALMRYLPSLKMLEELPAAIERARAALDNIRIDAAARRGAAMDFRDMTEFARGEVERALGDLG
jgi:predicted ATPase/class 3 adenylate cyclase